jgi:hypothetical protein
MRHVYWAIVNKFEIDCHLIYALLSHIARIYSPVCDCLYITSHEILYSEQSLLRMKSWPSCERKWVLVCGIRRSLFVCLLSVCKSERERERERESTSRECGRLTEKIVNRNTFSLFLELYFDDRSNALSNDFLHHLHSVPSRISDKNWQFVFWSSSFSCLDSVEITALAIMLWSRENKC